MKSPHYSIPITIGLLTAVLTVGINWGIMKSKADEIDAVSKKADSTELKVASLTTALEDIKDATKENAQNTKEILKLILENRK